MYLSAVEGQTSNATLGGITLPSLAAIQAGGAAATLAVPHVLVQGEVGQTASGNNIVSVASLQFNGSVYISTGLSYDADADHVFANLIQANTALTSFQAPCPLAPDVPSYLGHYSAVLGVVPTIWQSLLGGPHCIGGANGLSIVSSECIGYGLSTLNLANVKNSSFTGSIVAATQILTVTGSPTVPLVAGSIITYPGIAALTNVKIAAFGTSGTTGTGGAGTYKLVLAGNPPSTTVPADVSSTTMTAGLPVPATVWLNYPWNGRQALNSTTGLWNRNNIIGTITSGKLTVLSIAMNGVGAAVGCVVCGSGLPASDAGTPKGSGAVHLLNQNGDGTWNLSNSPPNVTYNGNGKPNLWLSNNSTNSVSGVQGGGDDLVSTYDGCVGGLYFISGTRTLLYIKSHAFSFPSFGSSNLACETSASGNCDPWRYQAVAYDLATIIANKNNGGAPSAVLPYAFWDLTAFTSKFGPCFGNAAKGRHGQSFGYDPTAQALGFQPGVMYGTPLGLGSPTGPMYAYAVAAS